jgi:multicomponent Na+:H+ antiporter subunit A
MGMRLDGLALLFALLITGIGTLILVYTGGYFKGSASLPRILSLLLFFMGAMLGLVLCDNLIFLFVYWELTSISSYLLIGFKHEDPTSRRNALQALLVTGLGGLALLGGLILIGASAGTYLASELPARAEAIVHSPTFPLALALILLGVFTKSAQFPFHFWLPNAMAAPTPVSAYLHSATMVKAGVFLLARLNPALSVAPSWSLSLLVFGSVTMLLGGALGLLQTDLKRILAYTTLAVLGVLTMLIGVGTELALQSAMFFLLGHALYKAALFLCAGNVDHACGTRDVRRLRGLRTALPVTAAAALLAALSKSGFPPFFGFLGKEYTYKTGAALEALAVPVLVVAFVVNMMLLALALQAGVHPFFGHAREARLDGPVHGLPPAMWAPPALLAAVGLIIGIFPSQLVLPLVEPAVSAMEGERVSLKVALWHGWNLPVLLTALTFTAGVGLYAIRNRLWKAAPEINRQTPVTFDGLYDKAYSGFLALAKWQTRILQTGRLHRYIAVVVVFTLGLLAWKLTALAGIGLSVPELPVQPLTLAVLLCMAVCAAVAITTTSRLTALANLGLTGFGIAFLFANYGAPDLAITQVLVETLTVVFFMVVLHHLPKIREPGSRRSRLGDAILAGTAGAFVSLLTMLSLHLELAPSISSTLAEWSYSQAYGRNVVNVILVDFRALDTYGEVLVLAIAAIGVLVLLSAARHVRGRGRLGKPAVGEEQA